MNSVVLIHLLDLYELQGTTRLSHLATCSNLKMIRSTVTIVKTSSVRSWINKAHPPKQFRKDLTTMTGPTPRDSANEMPA
jgi:hypothetical protein